MIVQIVLITSKKICYFVCFFILLGAFIWGFEKLNSATLEPLSMTLPDMLPRTSSPNTMQIYKMITGVNHRTASFGYVGGSYWDRRDFIMAAVLVRHPKGDFLIDAGLGRMAREHFNSMPFFFRMATDFEPGVSTFEQLNKAGYRISNLKGVLLTHAHWDHVSGLSDLNGVPVWVPYAESLFIHSDKWITGLIRTFKGIVYQIYNFEPKPYLGFPTSYDVYQDGSIVIVPSSGHTPGSVSIFVNLPSGERYAFIGDLVWQLEGLSGLKERPLLQRTLADENRQQLNENLRLMNAIQRKFPQIHFVPAHDQKAFETIPNL